MRQFPPCGGTRCSDEPRGASPGAVTKWTGHDRKFGARRKNRGFIRPDVWAAVRCNICRLRFVAGDSWREDSLLGTVGRRCFPGAGPGLAARTVLDEPRMDALWLVVEPDRQPGGHRRGV